MEKMAQTSPWQGKGDLEGYNPPFRGRFLGPRYWPIWLLFLLMMAGRLLPRRLWGLAGAGVGAVFYRTNAKRREIARVNLGLCFPGLDPGAREQIVRRHFRVHGQCLLDMSLVWWARPVFLDRYIKVEGLDHYRAAVDQGRPVILLTGHFSGLDIAGPVISRHFPQVGLIKPVKNPLVDWFIARGRRRFAGRVFLRDKGLRPVVRALQSGYGFYYLPDEDFGPERSVFVPFLGTVAATITALSRLARITNAAVLPTSVMRVSSREGYRIMIGPALENFPGDDERDDAARMNAVLGEMIRRAPEQYMWTFKYFRTRPDGQASPYAR
jgi:lipid A biosynthesis lauroyl/palmitoleoyl acyltransferase